VPDPGVKKRDGKTLSDSDANILRMERLESVMVFISSLHHIHILTRVIALCAWWCGLFSRRLMTSNDVLISQGGYFWGSISQCHTPFLLLVTKPPQIPIDTRFYTTVCSPVLHVARYLTGPRTAHKFKGRAFAVNYRKAPQYPWPCPVQDVLAACKLCLISIPTLRLTLVQIYILYAHHQEHFINQYLPRKLSLLATRQEVV